MDCVKKRVAILGLCLYVLCVCCAWVYWKSVTVRLWLNWFYIFPADLGVPPDCVFAKWGNYSAMFVTWLNRSKGDVDLSYSIFNSRLVYPYPLSFAPFSFIRNLKLYKSIVLTLSIPYSSSHRENTRYTKTFMTYTYSLEARRPCMTVTTGSRCPQNLLGF